MDEELELDTVAAPVNDVDRLAIGDMDRLDRIGSGTGLSPAPPFTYNNYGGLERTGSTSRRCGDDERLLSSAYSLSSVPAPNAPPSPVSELEGAVAGALKLEVASPRKVVGRQSSASSQRSIKPEFLRPPPSKPAPADPGHASPCPYGRVGLTLHRKSHMGPQSFPCGEIRRPAPKDYVRLEWEQPPSNVLLICKINDPEILTVVAEMGSWLQEQGVSTVMEPAVYAQLPDNARIIPYDNDKQKLRCIDLIICVGGDGTLLHANSLFGNGPMPPVLAFHMGSLGFLMNFDVHDFASTISAALRGDFFVALRMRLACRIERAEEAGAEGEEGDWQDGPQVFTVMNEMVVDRGTSPFVSALDVICDGLHVTTVQADGVIVATPTGSTAYSLSAGGSMVHPAVPGILFTPICPHILASRPILFPDYIEIRIQVPRDSRASAWASFDGRERHELRPADAVLVRASAYPPPPFCKQDETTDWFESLAGCLHWNLRKRQNPLKKGPAPPATPAGAPHIAPASSATSLPRRVPPRTPSDSSAASSPNGHGGPPPLAGAMPPNPNGPAPHAHRSLRPHLDPHDSPPH
eukprot:tig00000718_g3691.t1